ncbi:hypothetical protein BDQ12DRAFT_740083 [Crucibulum laeve]|uniref:Thioredoxin domain-containing protein n=1 Tax=Crucibulum laeve TaxID=68775 RepID=A0A5C3LF50_9AGAR|nr:hypothetical protein BDQ12DRAFT_740083 [Crucibulum laeve]
MSSVISNTQKLTEIIALPKTVVVYFYITECMACKQMSPMYESTASARKTANQEPLFAKFDIEQHQDLAERLNIEKFPTAVMFYFGKEIARVVGLKKKTEFEEWLKIANIAADVDYKIGGANENHKNCTSSSKNVDQKADEQVHHGHNTRVDAIISAMHDGISCTGVFQDRRPTKRLSMLLGRNKPFLDPEPECIIKPTQDLKGAQIGRANEGASHFAISLWNEPEESPQKVFFGLDFMPDPVEKERFESARFEVSFGHDDPQGQHPPLKILELFPTCSADLNPQTYDNSSISTFSNSSVDLVTEHVTITSTSTVVNGQGIHSPTAVWTLSDTPNDDKGLDEILCEGGIVRRGGWAMAEGNTSIRFLRSAI